MSYMRTCVANRGVRQWWWPQLWLWASLAMELLRMLRCISMSKVQGPSSSLSLSSSSSSLS
eukprot:4488780-Amphidinium_carterae.1